MTEKNSGGIEKIATLIVDKRNLFFLLYIFAFVFCIFSMNWVQVENDVTTYLPENTETRQGLVAMNENFATFGTAQVMVSNITYETAQEICDTLTAIDGIDMVTFDDTPDHYTNASALYDLSFAGGNFDLIVSNPPYITTAEMVQLDTSVKDFEPVLALHGGDDGLEFYRAIAKNYADALKPGGYLAFEFGMGQGDDVCRILEENGYMVLERTKDYNNIERAVLAQYGRKEVV